MKYNIEYLNLDNLHLVRTTGEMTGDDFVAMAEELLKQLNWHPNNNVLFDHRDLDFRNTSIEDIERIRNFHEENENRIGNGRSTILLNPGLASEWDKLWSQGNKIQTENNVQVFENYEKAITWIKEQENKEF